MAGHQHRSSPITNQDITQFELPNIHSMISHVGTVFVKTVSVFLGGEVSMTRGRLR
jgi:hypothetical protein